jgi:hypothetical protein
MLPFCERTGSGKVIECDAQACWACGITMTADGYAHCRPGHQDRLYLRAPSPRPRGRQRLVSAKTGRFAPGAALGNLGADFYCWREGVASFLEKRQPAFHGKSPATCPVNTRGGRKTDLPLGDFKPREAALACEWPLLPDFVAKSFWSVERKFLEPLTRFTRGDVRDHIVSFKIERTSVVALKRDAAAEKSKDRLSRDF